MTRPPHAVSRECDDGPILVRTVLTICAAVFVVVYAGAAYALFARFVLHGPVNQPSLEVSVQDVSAFGLLIDAATCQGSGDAWTCTPRDDSGGRATYAVKLRPGSSCWDAQLRKSFSSEVEPPQELSGCVRRWQWSLI